VNELSSMSKYLRDDSHKIKATKSSKSVKEQKEPGSRNLPKLSLLDILQDKNFYEREKLPSQRNHLNDSHIHPIKAAFSPYAHHRLLDDNGIRARGDRTGIFISSLGILPPSLSSSIKLLYLSNNSLTNLHNIQQFKNLETLTVAGNEIAYYEDLIGLKDLSSLTILDLAGNKVTLLPYFYDYILTLCPHLKSLKGYSMTLNEEEFLKAKLNYSKLLSFLSKAIYNEMKNKFVENLALRRNLHLDLKIGKRIYAQIG
jgi:hypothetical protein